MFYEHILASNGYDATRFDIRHKKRYPQSWFFLFLRFLNQNPTAMRTSCLEAIIQGCADAEEFNAQIGVNIRILPGDTLENIVEELMCSAQEKFDYEIAEEIGHSKEKHLDCTKRIVHACKEVEEMARKKKKRRESRALIIIYPGETFKDIMDALLKDAAAHHYGDVEEDDYAGALNSYDPGFMVHDSDM